MHLTAMSKSLAGNKAGKRDGMGMSVGVDSTRHPFPLIAAADRCFALPWLPARPERVPRAGRDRLAHLAAPGARTFGIRTGVVVKSQG